jgi:putative ABC transport system permease protein
MRERWVQVVGIAFIIALGIAVYSGLGSSTPWRLHSFGKSYDALNMYDLKIEFTPGSYLEAEPLAQAVRSISHASWIEDVGLRLNFASTVDASTPEQPLLVSGQVVGVEVASGGPAVNKLHVTSGRGLQASDASAPFDQAHGKPVCLVEHNFAKYHDLEPGRSVQVSGGYALQAVGSGISAEHFMVVEEGSGALGAWAQERFAALFVSLETAQEIAGLPGMVNEALITVSEGADLEQIEGELEATIGAAFPEVGISLEKKTENLVYRLLYDDVASDQENFDTFSSILLLGAALGAFILIGRIVDAQRREIGINMALGVPPRRIARRYLLIGAQIALLGMILGVVLGLLINQPLGRLLGEFIPMPYSETPFQVDVFAQAAFIGVLIPFLAVIYPVWRAVRVTPVDAIQTGYLVSKGGGLAPLLARVPLPGSSFTLFPIRNLSRGLRRTIMTVLGLSIAVTILIAFIGMIDTFRETLNVGRQEMEKDAPERTLIVFDDFYPLSSPLVSEIATHDEIAQAMPGVVLPGQLGGDEGFEIVIQLIDLDNDLWSPTIVRGEGKSEGLGVLISEKAARDLDADVGDSVTLRYPRRESPHAWSLARTPAQIVGVHPDILRGTVYVDIEDAAALNLEGIVNSLHVNPAAGVNADRLRQTLAQTPGVAAVRGVSANLASIESLLDQYIEIFTVIQMVVLVMAFFIAFNTTRSNLEERQRDIATMFAFGTRVRTAIRMAMVENLIIGALGTLLGIGLGWLMLSTTLLAQFEHDAPDLHTILDVAPATYGWAVLIGVIVVTVTPIFAARRLIKMDIPSTLRVLE